MLYWRLPKLLFSRVTVTPGLPALQALRLCLPARACLVWPTNEELMIAMDTAAIVKG